MGARSGWTGDCACPGKMVETASPSVTVAANKSLRRSVRLFPTLFFGAEFHEESRHDLPLIRRNLVVLAALRARSAHQSERRLAIFIFGVYVRAPFDQKRDDRGQAKRSRDMQGSVSVHFGSVDIRAQIERGLSRCQRDPFTLAHRLSRHVAGSFVALSPIAREEYAEPARAGQRSDDDA